MSVSAAPNAPQVLSTAASFSFSYRPFATGGTCSPHGANHPTVNFSAHMPDTDVYPPFDIPREELDLVLCSSDKVYFHTLKIFLSIASPFFKVMFTLPQPANATVPGNTSDDIREGRPVVPVTESSATLKKLLALCYPAWILNPPFAQLGDVQEVLEAATKYDMTGIIRSAGRALVTQRFLEQEPLRAFAIACQYSLAIEAATAARHTLKIPLSSRPYIAEFENITAGKLHRLTEYHVKCGRAAQRVTAGVNYDWITSNDYAWIRHSNCIFCQFVPKLITLAGDRTWKAAGYWVNFMQNVGNALLDCPCEATVMRKDLLDDVVAIVNRCSNCPAEKKKKAAEDLEAFRVMLAKEVERVVSLVALELKF